MSVGVQLLKRKNIVRKIHEKIHFFSVSLPATKELVPTDCFDSIPPTVPFFFFVTVVSESETKWESC